MLHEIQLFHIFSMKKLCIYMSIHLFFALFRIEKDNDGVFNGEWFASGETWTMRSPANGELLANVRAGTTDDYDKCVEAMAKGKKEVLYTSIFWVTFMAMFLELCCYERSTKRIYNSNCAPSYLVHVFIPFTGQLTD